MKNLFAIAAFVMATIFCISCKKDNALDHKTSTVIKASGAISDDIERFRNLLGGPVNQTPGASSGRREINWDGVPDNLEGKALPNDFFNPTGPTAVASMQRGLNYSGDGSFMVSSNGFANLNQSAASQFSPFSGTKVFANTTAAQWQIEFEVAGTDLTAGVKGFGMVFSDVDNPNSTSLEFFDGDKSLGKHFVPAHEAGASFSFLGIYFDNGEIITKVVVTHDGFLSEGVKDVSDNGTKDLVVVDDFIYSEPVRR